MAALERFMRETAPTARARATTRERLAARRRALEAVERGALREPWL